MDMFHVPWTYTAIFHRKCYRSQGLVTFMSVFVVTTNKLSDLKRIVVLSELKSDGSFFKRNVRELNTEFDCIVYIPVL